MEDELLFMAKNIAVYVKLIADIVKSKILKILGFV